MEQKNEKMEGKMKMWKMRKEMLDSMSEKELRAFITGYMMAESKILRAMSSECGCGCGQCCSCGSGQACDCEDGSCKCDEK